MGDSTWPRCPSLPRFRCPLLMSSPEETTVIDPQFYVAHAALSDLGMRRANNQDALAVQMGDASQWHARGHFFMVADGMGAHAAGELASKMAVDNVPHTYQKLRSLNPPAALRQAVHKANKLIYQKGQSAPEFNGMGTTCSCLALLPGAAIIAHVGDSRVYRLRCGVLEQLTFDHSLVWEMAAASDTSDENVPACIPKNVITRSLGPHATVDVDLEGPFDVCEGDKYLLCSDGLTGVVENDLIAAVVQCMGPDEAAATLVDIANLRGGPDNISLVVTEVPGGKPAPCAETHASNGSRTGEGAPGWMERLFGWVFGSGGPKAESHDLVGPYGNGPYRRYESHLASAALDIAGLCRELATLETDADSPLANHQNVDWPAFHHGCQLAEAASERHEPQVSLVAYAAAIRRLMSEVRTKVGPSDSGVL